MRRSSSTRLACLRRNLVRRGPAKGGISGEPIDMSPVEEALKGAPTQPGFSRLSTPHTLLDLASPRAPAQRKPSTPPSRRRAASRCTPGILPRRIAAFPDEDRELPGLLDSVDSPVPLL
jgi:hypothetical protein